MIERNTTIPVRKTEVFSTAEDSQTAVDVHVLQGERPLAADNMSLGRFRLDGIPPAPRGMPQVEVTFDIDANGILNVTAKDKATAREQKVTITASTNLNKQDIDRMVNEAGQHKAEDEKRKLLIEARNMADNATYQTEKFIRESGDKMDAADKTQLESLVTEVKSAAQGDDTPTIQRKLGELQQQMSKVGEKMHQQAGPVPEGGPIQEGQSAPGSDGDVVDGEFKSV